MQGAATGTASMAIILELFSRQDRVKALGWWSLVGAGGPVLGVTLGSPVIQYFGWRTLFWGQLVLLVIASAVVAILLPTHRKARPEDVGVGVDGASANGGDGDGAVRERSRVWDGMDWVGSWSLAGSVTAAMLVLSVGPIAGWTSPAVITCGVLAILLTAVFIRRELTFATPLVPTTYWRRRNFMFPMGTKAFSSFAYFGGFFLFPLLMEQVYGYSVSQVGFISVARPLLFAISAPIAGYMTVRTGERTASLFGTGSLLLSMILFATLSPTAGLAVILIALALSGLGMGVSMPATIGDHVQRGCGVGVRGHERRTVAGGPGRGGGRDPGGLDHSGVDRPQVGSGRRAPQHRAPAQLQRPVLGRCRRCRGRRRLCAVHTAAAACGPDGAAAGRRRMTADR